MENHNLYTKYFNNCKGVFQGGGCKAIAYVGAYKKAYERGVFFSELAGTSAGAIFASLIAAGAKPEYLEDIVHKIDFNMFIKDYVKPNCMEKFFYLCLAFIFKFKHYKYRKYLSKKVFSKNYGVFNSCEIENFVDKHLRFLTGLNKIVTFQDLVPDLNVVGADLQTHKVKVWNKRTTPEESVAKAVRCSCSIPGFFQLVDNRYVDGGMLSNLPNFVFTTEPHYCRVLNFKLESSHIDQRVDSMLSYCKGMVDTLVEGSSDIQERLHYDTFVVEINTSSVSSIDFAKMDDTKINELILSGEQAMGSFLDNERDKIYQSEQRKNLLNNKEKIRSLVSYISFNKHSEIYVVCTDTSWCWELFLTLLRWITFGTKIVIQTKKDKNTKYLEQEKARLRMLRSMGCNVKEVDDISINGYFFHEMNDEWKAVVYHEDDGNICGDYYESRLDGMFINEWIRNFKNNISENLSITNTLSIKSVEESIIINNLRNEVIYESANMQYEEIDLNKLSFMNPYIRALKYKQIDVLFELYKKNGMVPFGAAAFNFGDSKDSLIGPPVVEYHGGKYWVMEGNTRCVYAYRHGYKSLKVLVVRDVDTPIPCDTSKCYKISDILISDKKLEGKNRYIDFNYRYFRHIEENIRPFKTYLL